jgi:hypothetical protein
MLVINYSHNLNSFPVARTVPMVSTSADISTLKGWDTNFSANILDGICR